MLPGSREPSPWFPSKCRQRPWDPRLLLRRSGLFWGFGGLLEIDERLANSARRSWLSSEYTKMGSSGRRVHFLRGGDSSMYSMGVSDRPTRLVLIDDDASMIRILTTILEREFGDDIEVLALEHSSAALQWIQHHDVDIVITDLEMPRFNGLDLLSAAKRRHAWTQVFFMTGNSTLGALTKAIETGATDYLLKPLDRSELVEIVKDARKRLRRWRAALAGTWAAQLDSRSPAKL